MGHRKLYVLFKLRGGVRECIESVLYCLLNHVSGRLRKIALVSCLMYGAAVRVNPQNVFDPKNLLLPFKHAAVGMAVGHLSLFFPTLFLAYTSIAWSL
jgi:hypothetical protein